MDQYEAFINEKRILVPPSGFDLDVKDLNPALFDFQRDIVRWALRRGKAAIFADCGLGKTPMQLEWAHQVAIHTVGNVLIVAPLAVSWQTAREGQKFGIPVHVSRNGADIRPGINITNYERLHLYNPEQFSGIVLDESSILKAQFGIRRHEITDFALGIPYRLAASATPAPNDLVELINHAEFFGIMTEAEIKALFFTQDGNNSNQFRLKRHAIQDFWKWMAAWAVALRKPSDLGYDDCAFRLPPLRNHQVTVDVEAFDAGMLFAVEAITLVEQRIARRASLEARVAACADMVNNSDEPWLVWCDLNDESEALARAIPDAVQVTGSDASENKERAMLAFSDGEIRVLVTKPQIAGFGMNWQHCSHIAFVGLSHSYEKYYQAVRRSWRFGQVNPVDVYIITSTADGPVVQNIERKEKQAMDMYEQIVYHMNLESNWDRLARQEMEYAEDVAYGEGWELHLGDSVKTMRHIADESVGLSVFSPPFPGMYVYTNSAYDMGNVRDIDQMVEQFRFLMDKDHLLRILMPGRNVLIHITQGVAQKGRDGYIGIKDFRGRVIQMMQDEGWIYYGEVIIDKNPQLKATRTKDHGLMFGTLNKDAAQMHMALPDILLQFRKPGENPQPISAGMHLGNDGWITNEEWINWARPVWYAADYLPGTYSKNARTAQTNPDGIRETDVLNVVQARETNDERHLAPLQLGVIERCIKLWSAPGDLVYSPFAGIGSEGYMALKLDRRFVGGELKRSYWESAIRNLRRAEQEKRTYSLFDLGMVTA